MNENITPEEQRSQILSSLYLSSVYRDIYRLQIESAKKYLGSISVALEVGSAGGFMSTEEFALFKSDVRPDSGLSMLLDGRMLPFGDETLDVIFMKDALHHIPDVQQFLLEAFRVLRSGGGIVCIDPYWGPLARLIYRYFHPERFDYRQRGWSFSSTKPEDANQALLGILVRRDLKTLRQLLPAMDLIEIGPFVGPSYIVSGGVTRGQFIPDGLLNQIYRLETATTFWRKWAALEFMVVMRKKPN